MRLPAAETNSTVRPFFLFRGERFLTLSRNRKILFVLGVPAVAVLLWWLIAPLGSGPHNLLKTFALSWSVVATVWALRLVFQRFLWRVSRRLAFSYFLIGALPIPLVALVVGVGLYVLSGFFLGHLYRAAGHSLQTDLQNVARAELDTILGAHRFGVEPATLSTRFAYYKRGKHIAGDPDLPEQWQDFWPHPTQGGQTTPFTLFADREGEPIMVGGARSGSFAVLAVFNGDLNAELSQRTGIWAELMRADQRQAQVRFTIGLPGRRPYPLEALESRADPGEIRTFFGTESDDESWWRSCLNHPFLVWAEITRPFVDLESGAEADDYVAATLTSSLSGLTKELVSGATEVGFWVYLVFLGAVLVTLNVYLLAVLMALMMILGLSRAVNRLSEATGRLQQGDFSTRIEVFRDDQIGALQGGFNDMARNLEALVADGAQKEIFERELEIARQMQHGLLPDTLSAPAPFVFANFFQPSRAIGGDYYDLIRLADGRYAVVVADVSGHGLPAGLRMAMVKSAFELLCEESDDPIRILRRMHHLLIDRLRHREDRRAFVTATMAAVDAEKGEIEIVNAGHTPTYRLRDGEVLEIALPGPPLGILTPSLTSKRFDLKPGDIWLWLSDGIIEARNHHDEQFGYARVAEVMTGCDREPGCDPQRIKTAILSSLAEHRGSVAIDDDLTLVVMSWNPEPFDDPESH